MTRISEVTPEQISQLDPIQLTSVLRALVNAELIRAGIGLYAADIPLVVDMADGGEDGSVVWDDGPEVAGRIRQRRSLFQIKSGTFGPQDAYTEISAGPRMQVPSRIDANFRNGGTYILVLGQTCTASARDARVAKMREALRDRLYSGSETVPIQLFSGDLIADWANEHYGAALEVHSRLGVPINDSFQPWSVWAQTPRLTNTTFATNPELESKRREICETLAAPRSILRMIGLSGLGKTRLALEAFRPDPSVRSIDYSGTVMYVDDPAANEIRAHLLALRSRKRHGIVVVDNCALSLHQQLVDIVSHPESLLSLLTIDFDLARDDESIALFRLTKVPDSIIASIIRDAFPGMRDDDVARVVTFSDGFPRIASRLIESGLEDDLKLGPLNDSALQRRLLWGRETESEGKLAAIRACALFHHVGFSEPLFEQRNFVARRICRQDSEEFYTNVKYFIDRGIIDTIGAYIRVSPVPLALKLQSEWFDAVSHERQEALFTDAEMPDQLADALAQQYSLLDSVSRSAESVRRLTAPGAPFARLGVLNTKRSSRIFRVDIEPNACLEALLRVFGPLEANEVLEFREGRREIVSALERLVFDASRFDSAADLLLTLSAAENERWSNNATGVFIHLFASQLSGTETPPLERLDVVDRALASDDVNKRMIAIRALGHAVGTRHFSRTMGPERQGSRIYEDWQPSSLGEIVAYDNACLVRLGKHAVASSAEGTLAREQIADAIRTQVSNGNVNGINFCLETIHLQYRGRWPKALVAVREALKYEGKSLNESDRAKVVAWQELFEPKSLLDRLATYVSDPAPGWALDEFDDAEIGGRDRLSELAKDMFASTNVWREMLPTLLTEQHSRGAEFGERAAGIVSSVDELLEAILDFSRATPGPKSPAFLAGVLRYYREIDKEGCRKWLDHFATVPAFTEHLAWLTAVIGFDERDIQRLEIFVASQSVNPETLRIFSYGRSLANIPPLTIRSLFETVARQGASSKWVCLAVLSMYVRDDAVLWNECLRLLIDVVTDKDVILSSNIHTMDAHAYSTVTKRLLDIEGVSLAVLPAFVDAAIALCGTRKMDFTAYDRLRPIIFKLLELEKGKIWPLLRAAICRADALTYFHWSFLFIDKGPGRVSRSALQLLSSDDVKAWGQISPESMVNVLVRELPLFTVDEADIVVEPLVFTLLDEFGDDEFLRSMLHANLESFGYSGFADGQYETRQHFSEKLTRHPRSKVASWAATMARRFESLRLGEQQRQEEWDAGILSGPLDRGVG
jgi:hypothetical protein